MMRRFARLKAPGAWAAWAALAWLLVQAAQGLAARLGGWPVPGAAPDLVAVFVMGATVVALALGGAVRRPAWLGAAGGFAAVLALLLLGRAAQRLGESAALPDAAPHGVSLLGQTGLAVWLLVAGLHTWSRSRSHWGFTALAMALSALAGMTVAAAWAFGGVCLAIFGAWPAASALLSLPALTVVSLLTLAMVRSSWARDDEHPLRQSQSYRWVFAQHLAALLITAELAGLASAGAVAVYGADALRALAPAGPGDLDAGVWSRSVRWPLFMALLALSSLAVLGAGWSTWRQLPGLRRRHLAQAQAEATMQHVPLAMLVLAGDAVVAFANPAAGRLLGRPAAQLVGLPVAQLLPGWPVAPAADRGDGDAAAGVTLGALGERGVTILVEVSATHFQHEGERRSVLTLRDLRPQRRAHAELQRWISYFEQAGWGMAIGSAGDVPVFERVNPAFARMVGRSPDELAGQPIRQHVAPSHHAAMMALRQAAERDGHARAEMRHRRADGQEFPTLADVSVVRDEQGGLRYFIVSVQDITELKQAEDRAGQLAHWLRAVLDALPVGLWIGDAHGTVQQVNPAAERIWRGDGGALAAATAPRPWWQGQRLALDLTGSLLRRAVVTGARVDGGINEVRSPDGERRAVMTTASPILDEQGRVIGAVAVDEDLTELRRGEEAARQAQALLERILQTSAVGMAVCEADGRVVRCNQAWQALLGQIDAKAWIGIAVDDLLAAEDPLRERDLIRRICDDALPTYHGEHRMRRPSGAPGWTLLVVSRLPGPPGGAGQALVQVLDVDARHRASEDLAASRGRLAAAQWLAGVGDWAWRVDDDVVECSEQMLRMLGMRPAAAGRFTHDALLACFHPEDQPRLRAASQAALQTAGRLDEECRVVRMDGTTLDMHLRGVAQRGAGGLVMSGTLQDVTDRKAIERDLRQSRERLRELVAHEGQAVEEERKRIAREVHDELGQLLTALRMDLSMLRAQFADRPAAQAQADRMRQTMGTMTEVVRHVASNLRPSALDLGLAAAIEWLAEDFSHRWEVRCDVAVPKDEDLHLPEALELALFRVVQESLTNIARHAAATRVAIRLTVDHQLLHLSVRDDGQGFDVAAVAARRHGGGMGLLGMQERMHAIGARLSITSGPSGTIIDIRHTLSAECST